MTRKPLAAVPIAVLALFLATAGVAQATTFCVPSNHPGCPPGSTIQANLETAANNVATASDGVPDVIYMDPGMTYTDTNSLSVSVGTDQLLIEGGNPATTITSSATDTRPVVDLTAGGSLRPVTLARATIVIPAGIGSDSSAVVLKNDILEAVNIRTDAPGMIGVGNVVGGATIDGGTYGSSLGGPTSPGALQVGIRAGSSAAGSVTVGGVGIEAAFGVQVASTSANLAVDRSTIETSQGGLLAGPGSIDVSNSVLQVRDGTGLSTSVSDNSPNDATIDADGVTLAGTFNTGTIALTAYTGPGATGKAEVTIRSSIVDGFTSPLSRQGYGSGQANTSVYYSNFPSSPPLGEGSGFVTRENSIYASPQFKNPGAGDYTLPQTSPSVDRGDPASALTSDFNGASRPIDGNFDGTARVDQGAFEAPPGTDIYPPDTTITSGPPFYVFGDAATFEFKGTEGDTAKIQCSLDGQPWADCTSPKTFSGLPIGMHTFQFRAEDALGNQDPTPATTFALVNPPLDTTITSGPTQGSTIASRSATFGFDGTPDLTAGFECQLDAGPFAPCTSPKTFDDLSEGSHTVAFRAVHSFGAVDLTPATRTFVVDLTDPETTITSGPGKKAKKGRPSFSFTSNEGDARFACSLAKSGGSPVFTACSSPQKFRLKPKKKAQTFIFSVRAEDAAGNVDTSPVSTVFKVAKKSKKEAGKK